MPVLWTSSCAMQVRFEVETSLKYYDSLASQNQQWQAIKDKMKKDNENLGKQLKR